MHSKAISTWKYIHQHHPIPSNNTKEQKEITRKYKKMRHRWRPFSPSCLRHINTTLIYQHKIKRRKCKMLCLFIVESVFSGFFGVFVFFPPGEGAWAWVKKTSNINHTTPLDETPTNSTPYTCTQSPINAQTTQKS